MASNKRIILAMARGRASSAASAAKSIEHAETFLRAAFGFIGISDIELVVAEGFNIGKEREAAIASRAARLPMQSSTG